MRRRMARRSTAGLTIVSGSRSGARSCLREPGIQTALLATLNCEFYRNGSLDSGFARSARPGMTALPPLPRHCRLDQPDPIGRPGRDDVVVEIVGLVVQACGVAIADEDEGAGPRFQHVGE